MHAHARTCTLSTDDRANNTCARARTHAHADARANIRAKIRAYVNANARAQTQAHTRVCVWAS
eukprot:2603030-Pleurochrysis_carterae.AAC.1